MCVYLPSDLALSFLSILSSAAAATRWFKKTFFRNKKVPLKNQHLSIGPVMGICLGDLCNVVSLFACQIFRGVLSTSMSRVIVSSSGVHVGQGIWNLLGFS